MFKKKCHEVSVPVVGDSQHARLSREQMAKVKAHVKVTGEQAEDIPIDVPHPATWRRGMKDVGTKHFLH